MEVDRAVELTQLTFRQDSKFGKAMPYLPGALSFGYIYDAQNPNQKGVQQPILFTSDFAQAYDALTGTLSVQLWLTCPAVALGLWVQTVKS